MCREGGHVPGMEAKPREARNAKPAEAPPTDLEAGMSTKIPSARYLEELKDKLAARTTNGKPNKGFTKNALAINQEIFRVERALAAQPVAGKNQGG